MDAFFNLFVDVDLFGKTMAETLEGLAGDFLTPFFKIISILGEKGIIFFGLSIILMLFSKTRKMGICMFGAVACGALITNIILKNIIMRERPFEISEFRSLWINVGAPAEDGSSFPSGHVTGIMSAMTVVFIFANKKWSWVGFLGVILMAVSRVYLIVHFVSDVLAGIIVGGISGLIAYFITKLIYKLMTKYQDKKFCKFVLTFDIKEKLSKKQKIE